MLNKYIITVLTVFILPVLYPSVSIADDTTPVCNRLAEKASDAMLKYSLEAEVNGPVFFSAIGCGISYRNTELCAMEMVGFDTTAHVYDYYTAEKIKISKAYFYLDEKNKDASILAFSSQEAAAQYGAAKESGVILDYDGLTDRMLK
jgi:hypothetical protein